MDLGKYTVYAGHTFLPYFSIMPLLLIALFCVFCLPAYASITDMPQVIWQSGVLSKNETNGLAVSTQGKSKTEMINGRLQVSGEDKNAKVILQSSFKAAPFPTEVALHIQPGSPAFEGRLILQITDQATGAFINIMRTGGAKNYAWTFSEDGQWQDWKRYVSDPAAPGEAFTVIIRQMEDNLFQAVVNNRSIGTFNVKTLETISHFSLTTEGTGVYEVTSIKATRNPSVAPVTDNVTAIDITLLDSSALIKPANPNANGYQVAYFERGYSDGMNDPGVRTEFIRSLKELNASSLRFPGGTWAYWYNSTSPKSVAAFAKLKQTKIPYWVTNFSEFRWSDDDYFFGICKELGITAIYQINIATWYDAKTDRAVKLAPFDRQVKDDAPAERIAQGKNQTSEVSDVAVPEMQDVDPSYMKDSVANAAALARKAKALGVNVIWEFGNEDYVKFKPASYIRQSKAFYEAIKRVDPQAKFAFCADGDSWSDHTWDNEVYAQLVKNGMADIAEASTHMYLTGGGGGPRDTGANFYKATLSAWNELKSMHQGMKKRLVDAGLKQTSISLTEYNVAHIVPNYTGLPLEQSMGRALAEAAIWPELITRFNYINFHDFIRNGRGHGTWFAQLYYMPDNPQGFRYVLPLPAKVMAVMHRHADNQILHSANNLVVSQNQQELLISIGNVESFPTTHILTLKGNRNISTKNTLWHSVAVPDLSNPDYTAFELPVTLKGNQITVNIPAFSFNHITLPLK